MISTHPGCEVRSHRINAPSVTALEIVAMNRASPPSESLALGRISAISGSTANPPITHAITEASSASHQRQVATVGPGSAHGRSGLGGGGT